MNTKSIHTGFILLVLLLVLTICNNVVSLRHHHHQDEEMEDLFEELFDFFLNDETESDTMSMAQTLCTTDHLNVRSSPSTSASVIKVLPPRTSVNVLSTSGDWAKIANGQYVHKGYLGACATQTLCTTDYLNVRSSPSTSASVVKVLPPKTTVKVLSVNGDWANIANGQYVHKGYLGACGGGGGGGGGGKKPKEEEALEKIFGHEGKCQNWKDDTGNWFNGRLGYTCMGITPSTGYNNRNGPFNYALGSCGSRSAELFVKCAYDLNTAKFKTGSAAVYKNSYFGPGGCTPLPQPAFYICADISVNSGPGRSKQYLNELGPLKGDIKTYARKLNDRHRQDYIKWSAPGTGNERFRQGWLNRAADRDRYIDAY